MQNLNPSEKETEEVKKIPLLMGGVKQKSEKDPPWESKIVSLKEGVSHARGVAITYSQHARGVRIALS